jgi:AraC family transcriptional regulator of adaptative response/methylated-DNA-[protein]-cysteine methyltransferase
MFTSTSNADITKAGAADVLIPLIRTAATIGFAIAPCSLGFVIIAVSEHLIRSIMVGDDPEMLVSELQNQFPDDAIEVLENDPAGLVSKVVDLIEHPAGSLELPHEIDGIRRQVLHALSQAPAVAFTHEDYSHAE